MARNVSRIAMAAAPHPDGGHYPRFRMMPCPLDCFVQVESSAAPSPMSDSPKSSSASSPLTHFDAQGQAHMVDVGGKPATHRVAVASGRIEMKPETLALIESGTAKKGDVLGIARIAGIMAAKKTGEIIPLCHPLMLTRITIDFKNESSPIPSVHCTATIETVGATGVEIEAINSVQTALLTIYDMCKAADKGMIIQNVRLISKNGGSSNYSSNNEKPFS